MTPQDLIKIADEAMQAKHPAQVSAAQHFQISDVQTTFCNDYQQARVFLQWIAPVLAWWPQGGAVASVVLNGLLAVGDELYKDGCPTK